MSVTFRVHTTKKPFSKTCAILIQYALVLAAPVPDEFQAMNGIEDFYRALEAYYKELKDKGMATRRVGAGVVEITMNKKEGLIWIQRPMKSESAFATIICEQKNNTDERPGQKDAV